MKQILKEEFCKRLGGQKIMLITPVAGKADDWCEGLAIVLDTGEELKINSGSISGEGCLWF